eukprot:EG_transcript_4858
MQQLAEHLQCPVCLQLYRDPVLLTTCGHCLCQQCAAQQIDAMQLAAHPTVAFACPLCREMTPIPNGVASLTRIHDLRNMADHLRQHGPAPQTPVEGPTLQTVVEGLPCGVCEGRPATCGCRQCEALLCQPCHAKHHVGVLSRHAVTDVETYQRAAQRAKLVCAEHDERLKLYCPKCVQLVCTVCGFGKHKDHSCKPMEDAGECLPAVADTEQALEAVAAEMDRLHALLQAAETSVEEDGLGYEAECQRAFDAFLLAIRSHTQQCRQLVRVQRTAIEELQQRVRDLVAKLPGARVEFPERLELHCQVCALAKEVQKLEVTTPVRLRATPDAPLSSNETSLALVLPQLPATASGATHRFCCDLGGAYFASLIPEFHPEPTFLGLHCTHENRRCRKVGASNACVLAVAKEGFMAGQPQFTVHVINPGVNLLVGVAVANAPRTGQPYWHGLFLQHANGYIASQNEFQRQLTTAKCFPAGSKVRMRLDFEKGTASYEVDGRALGLAPCRLPPGPLYPAIVFYYDGSEVEFVQ